MAAIEWQPPRDVLTALLLGGAVVGADATNCNTMIGRLNNAGPRYDLGYASFGAGAVDASKAASEAQFAAAQSAWESSTEPVHVSADQFVVFSIGGASTPFAPDGSAGPALFQRLEDAETALANPAHPKTALKEELNAHTRAATQAYGARPTAPIYGPPYTTRIGILGGVPLKGISKSYNLLEYERDVLGPLVAEANLLILELS